MRVNDGLDQGGESSRYGEKYSTLGVFKRSGQQDWLVVGYRYERESGVKGGANGFGKMGLPFY